MRHVISALVMNEPGVLAGVANMFSARGFNIDSLVVGRTEDPKLSRMTIVCIADENTIEQVRRQLAKLVPVVSVNDFKGAAYIERDLALITVSVSSENRNTVIETVKLFRGKVVDVSRESVVVELAGTEEKIEAFIDLMKDYGIKELARTGVIAMARGAQTARDAVASGGATITASTGGKASAKHQRPGGAVAAAELTTRAPFSLSLSGEGWDEGVFGLQVREYSTIAP